MPSLKKIPKNAKMTVHSLLYQMVKDDCHTGDMQAVVPWCKQSGLSPGARWAFLYRPACWHDSGIWCGLSLLTRQIPVMCAHRIFLSNWICALSLQSLQSTVSRAYGKCTKSQTSKWGGGGAKVVLEVSVLLCSHCSQQQLELWLCCFSLKVDVGGSRGVILETLAKELPFFFL